MFIWPRRLNANFDGGWEQSGQEQQHSRFFKVYEFVFSIIVTQLFNSTLMQILWCIPKDLGMAPGGEFRRAVAEMKMLPNPILHLGDRSINITLQRAFNGLSLWQTLKIAFKLIFSNNTISKEEVEQCKQKVIDTKNRRYWLKLLIISNAYRIFWMSFWINLEMNTQVYDLEKLNVYTLIIFCYHF